MKLADTDLIYNDGRSWGDVAADIVSSNSRPINYVFNRRPFVNERGLACIEVPDKIVTNEKGHRYWETGVEVLPKQSRVENALMLRKDEWVDFDQIIVQERRKRLKFWADIAASKSVNLNGWASSIQEWETLEDTGQAMVDLDGLTDAPNFSPRKQVEGMPITCTHSDFFITKKELEISRKNGTALDTTKQEQAARRVLETIEQTAIGVITGLTYGTGTVAYGTTAACYGALNYPNRNTYNTLTAPTGSNATTTLSEILAMRDQMYEDNFFGPFMIYHSNDWDRYLDGDYVSSGGNNPNQTLRDRIKRVDDIVDVRRLDFLTSATNPFTLIMIDMSGDVVRAVIGLNPTTFQWEDKGGLVFKYKVLAMMMAQFRSTFAGRCGIVHGTV